MRPGTCDGELYPLVLPDRPPEDFALAGIGACAINEKAGIAQAFPGNQDALGIHAVEDVVKATPLLADQGVGWDMQVVEEQLCRGVVDHGPDRPDGEPLTDRATHIDKKHRQALTPRCHLFARCGARKQHHEIGMLRTADPDLLPVDTIAVAVAYRRSAEIGGIGARGRLGHGKSLQAQLSGGDARQILLLLRLRAMLEHGTHGVHLSMAGGAITAGLVDLLQHGAGCRNGQATTTILLGNESSQIARFGQSPDEVRRIGPLAIESAPVFTGEILAKRTHAVAYLRIGLADRDRYAFTGSNFHTAHHTRLSFCAFRNRNISARRKAHKLAKRPRWAHSLSSMSKPR